ncbi:MAG TPA: response regulator transcription factor [Roseovarius sp.]|nr:response regulator transcription factor [Roseovarius sp.]
MINASMANEEQKTIDLLLIDNHNLLVELLAKYLPRVAFNVTVTTNLEDGLKEIASRGGFDVVLVEVLLDSPLTLNDITEVVEANADGGVVLFSDNATRTFLDQSLAVGVMGLIPKSLPLRAVSSSINLVAAGQCFVPAEYFINETDTSISDKIALKPEELDVLKKLEEGYSNKEITRALDISESTVKMRIRSLTRKLNAKNRTHAVILARQLGVL